MRKDFKDKKSGDVTPNYHEGNDSRSKNEESEGQTMIDKDAPSNRYQTKQQIAPVAEAMDADTPKTSFQKKKQKTEGSQVKQEVASRVLVADSDFAGQGYSAPSNAGLRSLSFSGDSGTIIGSAANTPSVAVTDRNGDSGRFERKLDAPNKRINFTASEQVIEEYDNPAPLGQSGSEKQGYYGTPKNTSARSQKSSGAHPGDPLYQRSLDVISRDEVVFINGQYIKQNGIHYVDVPTVNTTFNDKGARVEQPIDISVGNYIPRELTITFGKESGGNPYVKGFHFTDVIDASINAADAETVNKSSTNFIIDMNKAEIARNKIDSNAGDETKPTWSDLGRAIPQPTQTNFLLYLMESEIGATVGTCYKFGSKAYAYQLNKSAKDGQHLTRPVREMMTGDIADYLTSEDYGSAGLYDFDPVSNTANAIAARRNGSAATMILLNDSAGGYTNKGKYLTSPKGLRQYFQIADNNMNVFRLKKLFGAALNNVDVFSTIDRGYDPLQPICLTDKVGLVYSIDPEKYAGFSRESASADRSYADGQGYLTYSYSNRMSNYTIKAKHPLWDGIATFIEQHALKLYSVLGGGASGDVTWKIPLHHSTMTFSLFDFLVMAAVPFIQRSRINSMRDVLDYEENFEYPYDLISIKEYNPTNAVNYSFKDIDSPLVSKQMIPSVAISWVMPEFFWGLGKNTSSTNSGMYVAPYYFSEHEFLPSHSSSGDNTGATYKDFGGTMTLPIIRSGVRLSYLDSLYSMSERDLRLCLDRMTKLPGSRVAGANSYAVYKYSQTSDGIPVFKGGFTVQEYLATPRELGWTMRALGGFFRCCDNKANVSSLTDAGAGFITTRRAAYNEDVTTTTSYRAYAWYGKTAYTTSILDVSSVNVDRAQAFCQNWDCSPAVRMARKGQAVTGLKERRDIGFFLSINQLGTINTGNSFNFITNAGYFHPFTTGLNQTTGAPNGAQKQLTSELFSACGIAKALWGRIQRLPMAISPYDTCDFDVDKGGAQFDPYDLVYAFGMAGTMASDYTEDLFDRMNEVQNQGWLFIEDPFVKDSPLFRDGMKYTM